MRQFLSFSLIIGLALAFLVTAVNASTTLQPGINADPSLPLQNQTPLATSEASSSWWTAAQENIRQSEYNITLMEQTGTYQAPNRANNFRTYFTPEGVRVVPRHGEGQTWELGLRLSSLTGENGRQQLEPVPPIVIANWAEYSHPGITESYTNDESGIRQGFIIEAPDQSRTQEQNLTIELALTGNLHPNLSESGKSIEFTTDDGLQILRYDSIHAMDALAESLPTQISLNSDNGQTRLHIIVDATSAVYPLSIQYLLSGAVSQESGPAPSSSALAADTTAVNGDWTAESDQADSQFGYAVSAAGDVNNDGFDDVIVGAWFYDNGQVDEGRVYAFYGSATGLSATPDWIVESNQSGARLGHSIDTAGDINNDGYDDVILGADLFDNGEINEGMASVYYGSATGLSASPDWTAEGNQAGSQFGVSVASAGDINGDGYDDILIGAYLYDNPESDEGRAFLYYGSAAGLGVSGTPNNAVWSMESNQIGARFGHSVGTAGDVNGDGFSDIIIGAYRYDNPEVDEGLVQLFYGSASGLSQTADWTADSNQAGAQFGSQVSTAGDVNSDGFSDIIAGAPNFDNGETDEGRAYVYYGSAGGLNTAADWTAEINQTAAIFGWTVGTAGDVNGDGYGDVIVGAPFYDNGETDEGGAFVYYGAAGGLSNSPDWAGEGNQNNAQFGTTTGIGNAGDTNGDGYADVIIGARLYDNGQTNEGQAYLYLGSNSGLSQPPPNPTPTPTNTPPPTGTEVIIDNTDPDLFVNGSWSTYTGSTYPKYGVDVRYKGAGTGSATATFQPNLSLTGDYEVFIWLGYLASGATNAPFTVQHAAGSTTLLVNIQGTYGTGGFWYSLGVFPFTAGTSGFVQLSDDADGTVLADAVRWVEQRSSPTPTPTPADTPTPIVTNTPANTPTNTPTPIATNTPANTPTDTPTPIATNTPANTPTDTPTPIATNTPANTPTPTPTDTPTPGETEVIVDNTDPDFFVTGSWSTYTGSTYPKYGVDARYRAAGTGSATATFQPNLPLTGDYEVFIWLGYLVSGATNAPFTVQHAAGSTTVLVNIQGTYGTGGFWYSLGVFPFTAGTSGYIQLSDDADGTVLADAARWVEQSSNPNPTPTPTPLPTDTPPPAGAEVIVDNADPDFFVSGSWSTYTGSTYPKYGVDVRYKGTGIGSATATFQPNLPATGDYEVFIWLGYLVSGATNAPFTVQHAAGNTTVLINTQGTYGTGGFWYSLGVFPFNAGSSGYVQLSDNADGTLLADAVRWVEQ